MNTSWKPKVEALAIDETGGASCWVKNYSHKEGTGFVQYMISPERMDLIKDLKHIAEYGLK